MIVLADMTTRSKRQLGHAKLVLSINFREEAADRRLELDLRNQALGIDPHRAASCLRGRFAGPCYQRQKRQRADSLENIAPHVFVAGHGNLLVWAHPLAVFGLWAPHPRRLVQELDYLACPGRAKLATSTLAA